MSHAPRPAQIVSVTAIDHSDRYEVTVEIDGRREVMSISESMLDMLAQQWPALKSGALHSVKMKGGET
jgi:hypothetical protein